MWQDGDTHMKGRSMVIRETQVFLTNPDMLHLSILPRHTQWKSVLAKLKCVFTRAMHVDSVALSNLTLSLTHTTTAVSILRFCRLIVVDEAHMYRGVFGSHVACVFRRLFRLCALYGSNPQVICCSATIRNPRQHFELLIPRLPPRQGASTTATLDPLASDANGAEAATTVSDTSPASFDFFRARPLCVITADGAPSGEKFFCLWNPKASSNTGAGASAEVATPTSFAPERPRGKRKRSVTAAPTAPTQASPLTKTQAMRTTDSTVSDENSQTTAAATDAPGAHATTLSTSSIFQTATIFARFVQDSVHTLLFCRGRKLTELMLMTVHTILREDSDKRSRSLLQRVSTYRGGYTLADRRSIEQRLFRGDLLGVIATNALELGIDVGDLDCTMHLGLPSSVASLWQQAGRAGRKHAQQSIAVVVCFDSPLDQHFARHAAALFALEPEAVALNPQNARVLAQHLVCAAREAPLYSPRSGTAYIDAFMFGELCMSNSSSTDIVSAGSASAAAHAASPDVSAIVTTLVQERKLRQCALSDGGGYRLHSCIPKQLRAVNLRSIAECVYQVRMCVCDW